MKHLQWQPHLGLWLTQQAAQQGCTVSLSLEGRLGKALSIPVWPQSRPWFQHWLGRKLSYVAILSFVIYLGEQFNWFWCLPSTADGLKTPLPNKTNKKTLRKTPNPTNNTAPQKLSKL